MLSPLDLFMASLQQGPKCEESLKRKNFTHTSGQNVATRAEMKCELTLPDVQSDAPISSLPAHTHTSKGFPCTDARMECETKCEGSLTLPDPPLQSGWLVAYLDRRGTLCGGCDDREHGTVHECRWGGKAWMVMLTDGQRLPLSAIRAVGHTEQDGRLVAAWTVRDHGYRARSWIRWD